MEQDVDQSLKVYGSWRWLVGLFAICISVVIQIYMLKYLDLTLLGANAVTAVVAAVLLSTQILGEKFVFRYDLPALVLIILGCATIVLNSNKTDTKYSAEDVMALLRAPRTICFIGFCVTAIIISACTLSLVLRKLRQFEKAVESYEEAHGLFGESRILPPRAKLQDKLPTSSLNIQDSSSAI